MVKRLIDVGNSGLKWVDWSDEIVQRGQFPYDTAKIGDLLDKIRKLPKVSSVFLASVASEAVTLQIADAFTTPFQSVTRLHSEAHALGVTNAYAEPHTLGVDRWLTLLGAWQLRRAPCVIVDAGTAVTVDALNGAGFHLGGAIFPDSALMQQALYGYTSRIPRASLADWTLPGRTTAACVAAGTHWAVVGGIECLASEIGKKLDNPRFLLTGGGSERLVSDLGHHWEYLPDLVFLGMAARAMAT